MVKKDGVDIAGMSTLTKKDHCHVLARSSEREEGGQLHCNHAAHCIKTAR